MSKKIWYSRPCAAQWDCYNKIFKQEKLSVDDFFAAITQKIKNPFASLEDNQMGQFVWDLWRADAKKGMLHLFFVDAKLRDWLEELPLNDLDGIKTYISENGIEAKQGILELKNFYFGIHIPYENKYRGYAFHLMNNQLNQMVLTWCTGENSQNSGWLSDENYKGLKKDKSEISKEAMKIFRLAINTIAYMKAFPNCIKDGVPKQINEPDSEKSFTLEIAEKVEKAVNNVATGRTLAPHERRDYFKTLRSEFYTHKRWQMIYIPETMVNGNAKTVYTTDKINDVETLT